MKEIINLAGVYLIAAIDDGYYDSNGCFYKKLTNSQRNVLSKKYIFDIKKRFHVSKGLSDFHRRR